MIEYSGLTQQSAMHYCARCESWQPRGELHFCTATERYKKAKAEGRVIYEDPSAVNKNAPKHRAETAEVNKIPVVNTQPVNKTVDVNTEALVTVNIEPVLTPEAENVNITLGAPVNKTRNDYHREYMRKKRAEAKEDR